MDKRENEQSVLPCQKLQINQVRSKQENIPRNKQKKCNCEEKVKWLHLNEFRIQSKRHKKAETCVYKRLYILEIMHVAKCSISI